MIDLAYYPSDADVPHELTTKRCTLTMLTAEHNARDYLAVMSTGPRLRARTDGRWPVEEFTAQQNLADLEKHEREHGNREAFTFTILDRTGNHCLGCLYLRPVSRMLERGVVTEGALPPRDYSSTADFWTVEDERFPDLEAELLPAMDRWLREESAFDRVYWTTTEAEPDQLQLLAATLRSAFVVETRNEGVTHVGFCR